MAKQLTTVTVSALEQFSANYFSLEVKTQEDAPWIKKIKAGQFANLEIAGHREVFLRRPLSIHDIEPPYALKFLFKVVGSGTAALAKLDKGAEFSLIAPLGNGFSLLNKGSALLVGGGYGAAPLLLLAKQLHKKGVEVTMVVGGRSADDINYLDGYRPFAKVIAVTEDGSRGEQGRVTDIIKGLKLTKLTRAYSCGPVGMMQEVHKICNKVALPLEISWEGYMGCGFGACLCCTITTPQNQNLTACTDGPVFDSIKVFGEVDG